MQKINTNNAGFVSFANRNWSYAGDKGSFARVKVDDDGNQVALVVKRAAKGMVSSDYDAEIAGFCAEHGINWSSVCCGQQVEVALV